MRKVLAAVFHSPREPGQKAAHPPGEAQLHKCLLSNSRRDRTLCSSDAIITTRLRHRRSLPQLLEPLAALPWLPWWFCSSHGTGSGESCKKLRSLRKGWHNKCAGGRSQHKMHEGFRNCLSPTMDRKHNRAESTAAQRSRVQDQPASSCARLQAQRQDLSWMQRSGQKHSKRLQTRSEQESTGLVSKRPDISWNRTSRLWNVTFPS